MTRRDMRRLCKLAAIAPDQTHVPALLDLVAKAVRQSWKVLPGGRA